MLYELKWILLNKKICEIINGVYKYSRTETKKFLIIKFVQKYIIEQHNFSTWRLVFVGSFSYLFLVKQCPIPWPRLNKT